MRSTFFIFFLFLAYAGFAQTGFSLLENKKSKRIEIRYNHKLITAYCYGDSTDKPVLFPINTLSGVTVTRGFPLAPRPGERLDKPHEVGLWLTYENVNGVDFWTGSQSVSADKKQTQGFIRYQNVLTQSSDPSRAFLRTHCHWLDVTGKVLVEEVEEFTFREHTGNLIIDRTSVLKANGTDLRFLDATGLLGLRVARELESPSMEEDGVTKAKGKADRAYSSGVYLNKEGLTGEAVSGKRSQWVVLQGKKDGQEIGIAIIDHPLNLGTPTYWSTNAYGLFAANPLGKKLFTNGKQQFNYKLIKDQSTTFRFRIIIHGGTAPLSATEIEAYRAEFSAIR